MIRVAVIGAGYWGSNLIRVFEELGVLEAVYDINPDLCTCPTLEEALERATAVAIATPTPTHFGLARQALLAGKHVLVEKPFTLTVEEAEELIQLAKANRLALMVGHLLRYHPAIVKLKELIDAGTLGKIRYIYSSRLGIGKSQEEDNILWDLGSHDISTMLMLLEETPKAGVAIQDVETNITTAFLWFEKIQAHNFISWYSPFKERKIVVVGSKRMAVFNDLTREKLFLSPYGLDNLKVVTLERMEAMSIEYEEPLVAECKHFLHCIQHSTTPITDGKEGLRVLQVLEMLQETLGDS